MQRLRRWPWLTFQMIAANMGIVLMLGYAWYWLFSRQSMAYSDSLMSTFNIEPGQVHAMFVDEVERQLWTSVIVGLLFAVMASVGLTLLIVRPLGALTRATDRLRQGDYSVRAQQRSGEVGKLADTINALAAALETEEERRARYLADLGHELRTPITSLRGYAEGLEDGVFAPDDRYFALMAEELRHLTALTHSIDAMELQADDRDADADGLELAEWLEGAYDRWQSQLAQKGVSLDVSIPMALAKRQLAIPRQSLRHVADNLLSNMIRYADIGHPCRIDVTLQQSALLQVSFTNRAVNLPSEVL